MCNNMKKCVKNTDLLLLLAMVITLSLKRETCRNCISVATGTYIFYCAYSQYIEIAPLAGKPWSC
jgi:hypothetical protein